MLHRKLCKSRIQSQSNRDQQWDSYHSKVTSAGFGRLGQIVGCILAALLPAYQLQAQVIEPPQLNISVYGELVSITWSEVADAEAYRLYYAPFPDAEVIESLVLGLTPSLSGILPVPIGFLRCHRNTGWVAAKAPFPTSKLFSIETTGIRPGN